MDLDEVRRPQERNFILVGAAASRFTRGFLQFWDIQIVWNVWILKYQSWMVNSIFLWEIIHSSFLFALFFLYWLKWIHQYMPQRIARELGVGLWSPCRLESGSLMRKREDAVTTPALLKHHPWTLLLLILSILQVYLCQERILQFYRDTEGKIGEGHSLISHHLLLSRKMIW